LEGEGTVEYENRGIRENPLPSREKKNILEGVEITV
jgi:hypothetical protein